MNDSQNSSPIVVIVIICAVLLLLCLAVPAGGVAIFYLREVQVAKATAESEMIAAQQQALAAQQAALAAQAEASRQAAEQMRLANEQMAKALAAPPVSAPILERPRVLSLDDLPVQSRQTIYEHLKLIKVQFEALDAIAGDDPALKERAAVYNFDEALQQLCDTWKIDRKQLDTIIAEGEKEMW
jgi:hypothetical protein